MRTHKFIEIVLWATILCGFADWVRSAPAGAEVHSLYSADTTDQPAKAQLGAGSVRNNTESAEPTLQEQDVQKDASSSPSQTLQETGVLNNTSPPATQTIKEESLQKNANSSGVQALRTEDVLNNTSFEVEQTIMEVDLNTKTIYLIHSDDYFEPGVILGADTSHSVSAPEKAPHTRTHVLSYLSVSFLILLVLRYCLLVCRRISHVQ